MAKSVFISFQFFRFIIRRSFRPLILLIWLTILTKLFVVVVARLKSIKVLSVFKILHQSFLATAFLFLVGSLCRLFLLAYDFILILEPLNFVFRNWPSSFSEVFNHRSPLYHFSFHVHLHPVKDLLKCFNRQTRCALWVSCNRRCHLT